MSTLVTTIFAAALVNNLVFVQLVGVSSLFLFTRRLSHAIEFAILATSVVFLSSLVNLFVYRWVLQTLQAEVLSLVVFAAVGALVSLFTLAIAKKHLPLTAYRQDLSLTVFSISSAVIGTALLNTTSLLSTGVLVIYCFGTAAGFGFTLIAFAALRQRIDHDEVPPAMRGAPLELVSAGIIAMAYLGFAGLV